MAPTADQVADEYRRLQSQLSGEAAAQVTVAYETLLNPLDLERTFPLYAEVVAQIIEAARQSAAVLAGAFYIAHREASRVLGEVPAIAYAGQLPPALLSTSLLVTGPVRVKRLTAQGASPAQAAAGGRVATARAAIRHVTDGGRATIRDTTRRDRLALGFARLTDGDPCYFCAMLASRGPVYESELAAVGDEDDPYHDGCGCVPAPVYRRADPWPGQAREYESLWKDATTGRSGRAAINAFRRAYEARQRATREGAQTA
ncbi:hypothetical protein [Micromonospora sp. KC213]|uniref:VG15 protein n=1 Tax=Micromonospora sp. KC213 TaxID=2530378 RepID=UPI00105004C3|nr:hypothetical protein [Micromonospora sp. KC213]TDC29864.1 hypothetical protein E1166_29530 [Micromonospora sp. KC213]